MKSYVAFLRGINVGGHKPVGMSALKSIFESLGFRNVRTILASGNVLFESTGKSPAELALRAERGLQQTLGYKLRVVVSGMEEIQRLVKENPFRNNGERSDTKFYVTFFAASVRPKKKRRSLLGSNFRIVRFSSRCLCLVVRVSKKGGTIDMMEWLDREFGTSITTRNWNTVLKVVRAAAV